MERNTIFLNKDTVISVVIAIYPRITKNLIVIFTATFSLRGKRDVSRKREYTRKRNARRFSPRCKGRSMIWLAGDGLVRGSEVENRKEVENRNRVACGRRGRPHPPPPSGARWRRLTHVLEVLSRVQDVALLVDIVGRGVGHPDLAIRILSRDEGGLTLTGEMIARKKRAELKGRERGSRAGP